MNRLTLLVLTGALLFTACGQSTPSPTSQSAQVSFRLTAPQGVTPNVTIVGPEGFNKTITTTGTAWFETLKFGTYTWSAANVTSGDFTYAAAGGKVDLAAGDDKQANVTYAPIDSALNFTLHAPDGVTPRVTLSGPDNFSKTFTTAGTSKLTGLKPGAYTWTATDVTAGNLTYVATGGSVNLVAGEAKGVSDTYASLVGTLDLTVTAPLGVTPNVTVTGPDNFSRTFTGAGTFKLAGLQPGAYTVAGRSVVLNGVRHSATDANTTVEVGQTAAVSVSYDDGVDIEAPRDVTLTAVNAVADENGLFHFTATARDNVKVNEFIVTLSNGLKGRVSAQKTEDGYTAASLVWVDWGQSFTVTVAASDGVNVSEPSEPIRVSRPPVGNLNLTLSAPEGVTPSVTVTGPDNFTKTFDTTGEFKLKGLSTGTYNVAASDVIVNGMRYTAQGTTVTIDTAQTVTASVAYGDGVDVQAPTDVTLTAHNVVADDNGMVTFTATARDNVNVEKFLIYADGMHMGQVSAEKTEDGYTATFSMDAVRGGSFSVSVAANDGVNLSERSAEISVSNPNR